MSGGCTDCGRSQGCGERKAGEKQLLAEILPALYPARRWGQPDDRARFRAGIPEKAARQLQRDAARVLEAPTVYRPGDEHELCDWIYVLCVGRSPGLVELLDGPVSPGALEGDRIREVYLRVALSSVARVTTVQEVRLELDRDQGGDGWVLTERPRTGIYDPILLQRTQRLVDLIVGADFAYLDFGLLAKPADGFDGKAYEERYGQPPAIVNYLFYPQPAGVVSTMFLTLPS